MKNIRLQSAFYAFLLPLVFFLASCSPKLMDASKAQMVANHKRIAILPANVVVESMRKSTPEEREKAGKEASLDFQKEMQVWLFKRKAKGKLSVDLASTESTNAALKNAGYFDGTTLSPQEIAMMLDVDAVITSNYKLRQPVSTVAAIAIGLFFNFWATTNQTLATLEIHDGKTGDLVWTYKRSLSGSAGSNMKSLVNDLMRHAARKVPYSKILQAPKEAGAGER